jgi:hypothetical protein
MNELGGQCHASVYHRGEILSEQNSTGRGGETANLIEKSLACRGACDIFHELCATHEGLGAPRSGEFPRMMKKGPDFPGLGRYMAVGIQMVVVTAVIAAIGWWLDGKTGCEPLFLIVFFFLGAFGGVVVVWRMLNQPDDKRR